MGHHFTKSGLWGCQGLILPWQHWPSCPWVPLGASAQTDVVTLLCEGAGGLQALSFMKLKGAPLSLVGDGVYLRSVYKSSAILQAHL